MEETAVLEICLAVSAVVHLIRLLLKPVIYILSEKDSPNKFARR
jgi:hypothetical protein